MGRSLHCILSTYVHISHSVYNLSGTVSDGATPLNLNVLKRDVDKCECDSFKLHISHCAVTEIDSDTP